MYGPSDGARIVVQHCCYAVANAQIETDRNIRTSQSRETWQVISHSDWACSTCRALPRECAHEGNILARQVELPPAVRGRCSPTLSLLNTSYRLSSYTSFSLLVWVFKRIKSSPPSFSVDDDHVMNTRRRQFRRLAKHAPRRQARPSGSTSPRGCCSKKRTRQLQTSYLYSPTTWKLGAAEGPVAATWHLRGYVDILAHEPQYKKEIGPRFSE